jgi:hypothetical protein
MGTIKTNPNFEKMTGRRLQRTAQGFIKEGNYAALKQMAEAIKDNRKATELITDTVSKYADHFINQERYDNLFQLFDSIQISEQLKETISEQITPRLKDTLQDTLETSHFDSFFRLHDLCERHGISSNQDIQNAITNGLDNLFGSKHLSECASLLDTYQNRPSFKATLKNALAVQYTILLDDDFDDDFVDFLETLNDHHELLAHAVPNQDVFAIPTSDRTHEYSIVLFFDRKSGEMFFKSGCLKQRSLVDLKAHWKKHADDQRRTRALPLIINSLKAIARGHFPKHATVTQVANPATLAKHVAEELAAARYQVPAYEGPKGMR